MHNAIKALGIDVPIVPQKVFETYCNHVIYYTVAALLWTGKLRAARNATHNNACMHLKNFSSNNSVLLFRMSVVYYNKQHLLNMPGTNCNENLVHLNTNSGENRNFAKCNYCLLTDAQCR